MELYSSIKCTYFTHTCEKPALPRTVLREIFAGGFHVRLIFLGTEILSRRFAQVFSCLTLGDSSDIVLTLSNVAEEKSPTCVSKTTVTIQAHQMKTETPLF